MKVREGEIAGAISKTARGRPSDNSGKFDAKNSVKCRVHQTEDLKKNLIKFGDIRTIYFVRYHFFTVGQYNVIISQILFKRTAFSIIPMAIFLYILFQDKKMISYDVSFEMHSARAIKNIHYLYMLSCNIYLLTKNPFQLVTKY